MEISYNGLRDETIKILETNPAWVLSTSKEDHITSRMMSIINDGLDIYFQTNSCYIKHEQMSANKQVALCWSNVSIEGAVESIGRWEEPANQDLRKQYISKHKSSYEAYGELDGQCVYKVSVNKVKYWKYVNGKPIREVLDTRKERAERLDFM